VALAPGQMGIHSEVILGLDPGRGKTGFAFVGADGALVLSGIFPSRDGEGFWAALNGGECHESDSFAPWLRERPSGVQVGFTLTRVAVGNGTCGSALCAEARRRVRCPVAKVDECGTTLEARTLYWRLHRPAWWQSLLPYGLRVPPRPLDDLAAWAIVLRSLCQDGYLML
jgi:hypothetical protein